MSQVMHPGIKRRKVSPYEDEGTNDTGVSLAEQSAFEFEELKRREMIERVRAENAQRAKAAADAEAKAEAERKALAPALVVHQPEKQNVPNK